MTDQSPPHADETAAQDDAAVIPEVGFIGQPAKVCLLYTSPSPRD